MDRTLRRTEDRRHVVGLVILCSVLLLAVAAIGCRAGRELLNARLAPSVRAPLGAGG